MPLQESDYELIDTYLLGRLDEAGRKTFGQRQKDAAFQKELTWRKEMQLVFKKSGRQDLKNRLQALEQETTKSIDDPKQESTFFLKLISKRWMSIAAGILFMVIGFWLWNTQINTSDTLFAQYYEPYPNIVAPIIKSSTEVTDYDAAFQLYEQQQYESAIQLFKKVPLDEATEFYQALSFLGQENYSQAIARLSLIAKSEDAAFQRPAQWYAALAYLQLNQSSEAKILLIQISNIDNHRFQSKAKRLLEAL